MRLRPLRADKGLGLALQWLPEKGLLNTRVLLLQLLLLMLRPLVTGPTPAVGFDLLHAGSDPFGDHRCARGLLLLFFSGFDELGAVLLQEGFRRLFAALLERALADKMVLSLNLRQKEGGARKTEIVFGFGERVVLGQLRSEAAEELRESGGRSLQMDAESPEAAKVVIPVRVLRVSRFLAL